MGGHIPQRLWPVLQDQVRCALGVWQPARPGHLGGPRRAQALRLIQADVLGGGDRGARLAELEGEAELATWWQSVAEEIREDILEPRGFRAWRVPPALRNRCARRLDAADPLVRFLPPEDERVKATVLAIATELRRSGFVLRYRVAETDDGLTGEEGTFLICSFWLVSALSEIGEAQRAMEMCERLLAHASPLGLYAEELDARTGRHLGNYPQAFTHLALINAVIHVISQEEEAT